LQNLPHFTDNNNEASLASAQHQQRDAAFGWTDRIASRKTRMRIARKVRRRGLHSRYTHSSESECKNNEKTYTHAVNEALGKK
jgi:hypothetical protein